MINLSTWFLRLAVLYFIAGVSLGIFMAASHNYSMLTVHAHLNLLGWVTLSLFGLFYRAWPAAATTTLAKVHFWIYVPAHFVQMVLLYAFYSGRAAAELPLAAASVLVGVAVVCFAVIVWKHTSAAAQLSAQ